MKTDAQIKAERAALEPSLGPTRAGWYAEACKVEGEGGASLWACRYREMAREAHFIAADAARALLAWQRWAEAEGWDNAEYDQLAHALLSLGLRAGLPAEALPAAAQGPDPWDQPPAGAGGGPLMHHWTKRTPAEPGWYWWRKDISHHAEVVQVGYHAGSAALRVSRSCVSHTTPLVITGGEWFGPLREPGGDAVENCGPPAAEGD